MRTSAAVALVAFAVYLGTFRPFVSMDATTNVLVAYAFARDGTAYLDAALPHWNEIPFFWQRYGGHVISWTWYAPGAELAAAPIAWAGALLGIVPPQAASVTVVGRIAAALFAAMSVFFVHASASLVTGRRWAVVVAGLYAFGTATWPISAGGLWQHAPAQLAVAAGIFLLLLGRRSPEWYGRAGLAFAAAAVIRPADVVFFVPVGMLVALRSRRTAVAYALWACAPLAILAVYLLAMFGTALPPIAEEAPRGDLLVGLAGNLVSPSRGILVASPFLVFAAVELVRRSAARVPGAGTIRALAIGVVGVLLIHSQVGWWWGGTGYLNRYLADALPVLALGLAFWVRRHRRGPGSRIVLAATAVPSVAIAAIGALVYEWRDVLWEASSAIPIDELVWRPDRMEAWYALTTSPRLDEVTLVEASIAIVAAGLLVLVARHPSSRHRRRAIAVPAGPA